MRLGNLIKHDLANSKKVFHEHQLHKHKYDSKNYWRTLNEIICKQGSTHITEVFDPSQDCMVDSDEAAEQFNTFYVDIADKLIRNIPTVPCDLNVIHCNSTCSFDSPVSEHCL